MYKKLQSIKVTSFCTVCNRNVGFAPTQLVVKVLFIVCDCCPFGAPVTRQAFVCVGPTVRVVHFFDGGRRRTPKRRGQRE